MRDLVFLVYLALLFGVAIRRPFLLILVYAYIDIVSPQRLTYYLLNSIPLSAIAFALAFLGWIVADDKRDSRFSVRQLLLLLFLGWCAYTTGHADFPVEAMLKWDWVWKAMVFAIFLPLTLRTRLRFEALALIMVLCASSIIVTGGIKTALSGGGYGQLNLMVDNNSGLYESSIISTVAIAIIPLILWLARFGTIYRPSRFVGVYCAALILACLLIPVGTEARTGLLCAALLAVMLLIHAKRRLLYGFLMAGAALAALPLLPASFTQRMDTIQNYQGDNSASTRLAVWKWTWDYVQLHPGGGGFDSYRSNSFTYDTIHKEGPPGAEHFVRERVTDKGRAFHNSYFEVLGEQGFLGLGLWLAIHLISLARTARVYRLYRQTDVEDDRWVAPFALALLQGQLIYLLGAMFVGIAYQPFIFMLLAMQIGLATYISRIRKMSGWKPIFPAHHPDAAQTAA